MRRRFGLRHLLPVVESVLYVLLWTSGMAVDSLPARPASEQVESPHVINVQEGIQWVPQKPPSFSLPTKFAICLNLPAFMLAAIVASVLHRQSLMWLFWCSALIALPLWYSIGRFADREIGLLPSVRKFGPLSAVLLWFFAVLGPFLLTASVYRFVVERNTDNTWIAAAFIVWSGVLNLVTALTFRRRARWNDAVHV